MRNTLEAILVNAINGTTIAVITLDLVKDILAIILFVVSIISTLVIIRNNTRRNNKE